ncbi:MAG TPA: B-box zinc finger protein [Opitutaceae bacterium]|nr:B-box zinc finger protein [Opitutaceae bacterium]
MPPPPVPEFRPVAVRAWRCARHPDREAAARCPACGQPFCRECVVEHEGRLLCSGCLAKLTAAPARASRDLSGLRHALSLAAAAVFLWFAFFFVGELLARIPQNVHDATVWQELPAPGAKP